MSTPPLETEADARALPAVAAVHAVGGHDSTWSHRRAEAEREVLRAPLREAGVIPGAYEGRFLDWLAGFEPVLCGAAANLMRHMYEAGLAAAEGGTDG